MKTGRRKWRPVLFLRLCLTDKSSSHKSPFDPHSKARATNPCRIVSSTNHKPLSFGTKYCITAFVRVVTLQAQLMQMLIM
jgi:hypothetical protein